MVVFELVGKIENPAKVVALIKQRLSNMHLRLHVASAVATATTKISH